MISPLHTVPSTQIRDKQRRVNASTFRGAHVTSLRLFLSQYIGMDGANAGRTLFLLEYGLHRVLVKPPTDFALLTNSIRRYFPEIPANHSVSYWTSDLAICGGLLTEVVPDMWSMVIPMLWRLLVWSQPQWPAPNSGETSAGGDEDEDDGEDYDSEFSSDEER